MTELLEKLLKDYSIFNSDEAYYNNLISIYSCDLKRIKEHILDDIRSSWNNYNIDWFINFANKNDFDETISLIKKYRLELNPIVVQSISDNCSIIDKHLNEFLSKKELWTEDDLELGFSNSTIFDLVYNYAIIHNKIDLGKTVNKYVNEVNYDAYIGDSTKVYIKEIQGLQAFDKNHERIVNYNEYKKLALATTDQEMAKKYEKEALKLRKLIIEGNLCLAIPMASKYRNRGVDFLDLIQEGSIGIMTALERFDPNRSYAFSTYAIWWVKQAISRYIMVNCRTIRLPIPLYTEYSHIKAYQDQFLKENFREPTTKEIANKLGWQESKVRHILKSFDTLISLDSPIKNDENEDSDELYDFVSEEYDYVEELYKSELVDKILKGLTERQEFVIRMRYGLANGIDSRFECEHTLEEVGQEMNLTRERVRQIEKKVIDKFREKEKINVAYYPNKKNCHFWEFFDGIDRSTVYEKMKYLSDKDLNTLYEKYGEDLEDFVYTEPNRSGKVFSVIYKIKKMLNEPNYHPQYYNKHTNKHEARVIYKYDNIPIIELVHLNADSISALLKKESSSLKLLKKVFGNRLNKTPDIKKLNQTEISYLNNIINNLLINNNISRNLQTLREIMDCTDDEYNLLIEKINLNKNSYKRLYALFGDNLDQKIDYYLLNQNDYNKWLSTYNGLKTKLNKIRTTYRYYSPKSLGVKINRTEDEVRELISKMNKDSMIYAIINKYLNQEVLSYTEKTRFDHWCLETRKRDVNRKYNKDGMSTRSLSRMLGIDINELILVYNTIDTNTKLYNILTSIINNEEISDEDASIVRAWVTLKVNNSNYVAIKELPDTYHTQKLLEDFQITKEELLSNISNINPESRKYQAIIKYLNEEKLDRKEYNALFNWKSLIKKIFEKSPEILLSSEHETIKPPINTMLFKDLLKGLDKQIIKIMELRLGIYDGTIYSVKEIAEIFNISEKIVNESISEGLNIINSNKEQDKTLKLVKK